MVYSVTAEVLGEVRKAKTTAQVSLRTDAESVVIHDTAERRAAIEQALDDLKEAARARDVRLEDAEALSVEVELAEPDAA
jgi:valyl-tRNA synthetase